MPFGNQCEFKDFSSCVTRMTGKVDNPEAYCATLMRKTEAHCKGRSDEEGITVSLESLTQFEAQVREAEMEALEAYRKGTAPAPVLYRAMGAVKSSPSPSDEVMTFVASDESEARDGHIIRADGWDLKGFQQNPVYMFGHDHSIPPIGTVPRVWVEGKQLLNNVQWDMDDPFAAFLQGKYLRGIMRAESIAWRPIEFNKRKDGYGLDFLKNELLEISAVSVPMHPAALRRALGQHRFGMVLPIPIEEVRQEELDSELERLRAAFRALRI